MNADILTAIDLRAMLRSHQERSSTVTVASRILERQIDFGVLVTDGDRVTRLDEKPIERHQINAGIYVLDPGVLSLIPHPPQFINMTDIIKASMARGDDIRTFAIHEYWRDIGRPDDLKRASEDFETFFQSN